MTLLERLGREVPHHRKKSMRNDFLLKFIRNHFNEIDEAREKGYSWVQIRLSMLDLWPELAPYKSTGSVERIYHEIRKEKSK